MEILNNRIDHFKNHTVDFYSSEIYKNAKEDNILIVFSSTSIYIIDITRRELKSVLHYSEILDLNLEAEDKIRIYFKKTINGVRELFIYTYMFIIIFIFIIFFILLENT